MLRGWTQGVYWSAASGTLAWPSGTVAGDTALLHVGGTTSSTPKRQPTDTTGWQLANTTPTTKAWLKVLTASDVASPLAVLGSVGAMETFPGAWRLGQVTEKPGATMSTPGSHLIVYGRGRNANALTPSVGKLGVDYLNAAYLNRANAIWSIPATAVGYLQLAGAFNGSDADGFELIPPAAPASAVLTSPSAGVQVNPAVLNAVGWQHQSLAGRTQSAYKVRVRAQGAATWSYLVGGALTATETAVAGDTQTAPINAGALTSPTIYEWSVSTTEDGTNWSTWADTSTFQAITAPVVTSVTVSAPAGDVTPDVSYTRTLGAGVQTAYQVAVTPATSTSPTVGPIHDTGVVSAVDNPVTIPDRLQWANGQALRFWVRVWQTGGMASQWAYGSGTVSWTPPSAPTAVVPVDGSPLQVTVAGLVAGLPMRLQTSTDGTTWTDVVATTATSATMTIDQPLAGYGVPTLWRAARADANGRWSTWTTSVAVATMDRSAYWVSDDGLTWLRVCLAKDLPGRLSQDFAVWQTLAGGVPRVDRSAERGWAGEMSVRLPTRAEAEAAIAWLRTHDVWRMRWNPEADATGARVAGDVRRIARTSQIGLDRLAQIAIQHRTMPVSWVEQ